MLDHVGIGVSDLARSEAFYSAILAPLGYERLMQYEGWIGFGAGDVQRKPSFWIYQASGSCCAIHVAFRSRTRAAVDRFHAAALAAGGLDNGAPGLRPHYHPTYYAAFVRDADGNNIEAVCHAAA